MIESILLRAAVAAAVKHNLSELSIHSDFIYN